MLEASGEEWTLPSFRNREIRPWAVNRRARELGVLRNAARWRVAEEVGESGEAYGALDERAGSELVPRM